MQLDHLIITRFSYRGWAVLAKMGGPRFLRQDDPLDPKSLDQRFRLFEIASLPSIRAQVGRDFGWVLLIDPELPGPYRRRLEQLVDGLERVHLHEHRLDDALEDQDWLTPYIAAGTTHLLTTNLDDDDLLAPEFTEVCRAEIRRRAEASGDPRALVLGSTSIWTWDMLLSPGARFGYASPWHRGAQVSACGFSLLCERTLNVSVMGLRHRFARLYLDPAGAVPNDSVAFARRRFASVLDEHRGEALYADLGPKLGPMLMTNHSMNDQASRVVESKPRRIRVRSPADLRRFPIDWAALERHRTHFSVFRLELAAKWLQFVARRALKR